MNAAENYSGYECGSLFGLCERENNSKRKNLIVNRIQGKHIPAVPSQTLELFSRLGDRISIDDDMSSVMVIGFAETATALAAQVAVRIGAGRFITTTREKMPEEFILADFSEEHSHATEQRLFSSMKEEIFGGIRHIVFVDDELTTGKTVLNFIEAVKAKVSPHCRFYTASLINGMNTEHMKVFAEKDIGVFYLIKIADSSKELNEKLDFVPCEDTLPHTAKCPEYERIIINGKADPRLGCDTVEYLDACNKLSERISELTAPIVSAGETLDIIGTEECMYPAIKTGELFEKNGCSVRSHSTTRSPIVPSLTEGYPLHMRARLHSVYELERRVFLYNIDPCDTAIIISDSEDGELEAERELVSVMNAKRIIFVYWR